MRSISVSKIAISCLAALVLTFGFNNCGGFTNGLKSSVSSASFVNRAAGFNFSAKARKIWIHPNAGSGVGPSDWDSIFSRSGDWQALLSQTNVFQFFEWAVPQYSQGEIKKAVTLFRAKSVGIGLESSGLLPWCYDGGDTGVPSAQSALRNMKPIYDAGGYVNFIALDNSGINLPIIGSGRVDNTCNYTVQQAITQLIVYMKFIHQKHPEIVFGLLPNLPNYNFNGTPCYFASCGSFQGMDYKDVFTAIVNQARDSGEDFGFVHVDNPYEYMTNHRGVSNVMAQRIIPLKQMAEGFGLRFGVILNSDLGGGSDNQTNIDAKSVSYFNNNKADLGLYADGGGLDSMDFIVESWYNFPHYILSETTAYSFTNLCLQMISDYEGRLWGKSLSQPTANPAVISEPTSTTNTLASSDPGTSAASPSSAAASEFRGCFSGRSGSIVQREFGRCKCCSGRICRRCAGGSKSNGSLASRCTASFDRTSGSGSCGNSAGERGSGCSSGTSGSSGRG